MLSHCVLDYVAEGCAAAVILYASVCPCACGKNSVFVKREERMSAERRVCNHRRAELHGNRVALHLSVCLCVSVCACVLPANQNNVDYRWLCRLRKCRD